MTLRAALGQDGFTRFVARVAMSIEHLLHLRFDLLGLALEFSSGTARRLAGIAGELHPVDGEHLAPDESLGIAQKQHLGKQNGDLVLQLPHKRGNGGEVRDAVARQDHEGYVVASAARMARLTWRARLAYAATSLRVLAGCRDLAAANDAAGVSKQNHFEQDYRCVGRSAAIVIAKALIRHPQIELVI
jgi:hypothetical protein